MLTSKLGHSLSTIRDAESLIDMPSLLTPVTLLISPTQSLGIRRAHAL